MNKTTKKSLNEIYVADKQGKKSVGGMFGAFWRHGPTPWNNKNKKEDRAQGSSDLPVENEVTAKGQDLVRQNAKDLAMQIQGMDRDRIYIYTTPLRRTKQTSRIIAEELGIDPSHIIVCDALGGRAYGKIEGMANVKSPKTIARHPLIAISYLMAQFGFENNQGIESKPRFQSRVDKVIDDILVKHKQGDFVIISANSDVWDTLRKSEFYNSFINFEHNNAVEPGECVKFNIPTDVMELIEIIGIGRESGLFRE